MNLVIFGPPGAGKGTQSNIIVKKYKLYQLSTGELLRTEIKNNTDLGKQISSTINDGNLVSDEIVGNLIAKYISNENYRNRLEHYVYLYRLFFLMSYSILKTALFLKNL